MCNIRNRVIGELIMSRNKTNAQKKGYKYYPCYKDSSGNCTILAGRDSCEEAYKDLKDLEPYVNNDLVFIGVIKSRDVNPLSHICHLN